MLLSPFLTSLGENAIVCALLCFFAFAGTTDLDLSFSFAFGKS